MKMNNNLPSKEEILAMAEKIKQNIEDDEKYTEQIKRFLSKSLKQHEIICLGNTPFILQLLGSSANKLIMQQDDLNNAMKENGVNIGNHSEAHNIPINAVLQLSEKIREPILILKGNPNNPNSVVLLTELENDKGGKILAPISLDRKSGSVNIVKSLYVKDNAVDKNGNADFKKSLGNYLSLHKCDIIAIDINKAEKLYKDIGLQLPSLNIVLSFDNSISYSAQNVKYISTNFFSKIKSMNTWSQKVTEKIKETLEQEKQHEEER